MSVLEDCITGDRDYKNYVSDRKNIVNCPVCNIINSKTKISRHIMNSKDNDHKEFVLKQNDLIISLSEIYHSFTLIALHNNIFCSPTYIRTVLKNSINYKDFLYKSRSNSMKKQYEDGRRHNLLTGWSPKNRKECGKRTISDCKYKNIIELFDSDLTLKEVSETVGCKNDTVNKYWIEMFGKPKTSKRNRANQQKKLTVFDLELSKKLTNLFYDNKTKLEIAVECNISIGSVCNFFRNNFSASERKKRSSILQKIGLKRSLIKCGSAGITGSKPENLCYNLLQNKLNYKILHHDCDVCEPYEVDITIPEIKVAISWDGPFHRKPIFGEKKLNRVVIRDKKKIKSLQNKGWKIIVVVDDSSKMIETRIESVVNKIISIIDTDFGLIMLTNK